MLLVETNNQRVGMEKIDDYYLRAVVVDWTKDHLHDVHKAQEVYDTIRNG